MAELFGGIDVGKSGAIGIVDGHGQVHSVCDMPFLDSARKDIDVKQVLALLRRCRFVVLEYQQVFPAQGAVSAFTLGDQYGALRGLLIGADIPFQTIKPTVWKPGMSIPAKAEKSESKIVASRLWPTADLGTRQDQGRSDALLLAEYGRRMLTSSLYAPPEE